MWREASDSSDSWSFKMDDAGRWLWQRKAVDGSVILTAVQSFPTLEECKADAKTRGYRD